MFLLMLSLRASAPRKPSAEIAAHSAGLRYLALSLVLGGQKMRLLVFVSMGVLVACATPERVRLETPDGVLNGRLAKGTKAFLGLPFAQSPTAERRFAPPLQNLKWQTEWSALARDGDPNGSDRPGWSRFEVSRDNVLRLDVPISEESQLRAVACDFWDSQL